MSEPEVSPGSTQIKSGVFPEISAVGTCAWAAVQKPQPDQRSGLITLDSFENARKTSLTSIAARLSAVCRPLFHNPIREGVPVNPQIRFSQQEAQDVGTQSTEFRKPTYRLSAADFPRFCFSQPATLCKKSVSNGASCFSAFDSRNSFCEGQRFSPCPMSLNWG